MVQFNADPSADKGSTFPDGEYFLKCVDVQSTEKGTNKPLKSKKSGNDMYVLEMAVVGGRYQNRRLWHYLPFIPAVAGENNGHGMTLKCLHAFGIETDGPLDITPELFKGVTIHAMVVIDHKDKQFDPKNVIKRFLIVDDPTKKPETTNDAQTPEDDGTDFPPQDEQQQPPARPAATRQPAAAAAASGPAKAKAPWRGR